MTAAGQTYEEIAHLVAEQVGGGSAAFPGLLKGLFTWQKQARPRVFALFLLALVLLHPSSETTL